MICTNYFFFRISCILDVSPGFAASDYGSDCDGIGAPYITTEELCRKATYALLSSKWDVEAKYMSSVPKGCVGWKTHVGNLVKFNLANDDVSRHPNYRSFCIKGMHYITLYLIFGGFI